MCARKARNTLNINSQKQHKLPKKYHPNKKHFTKNTLQKTKHRTQISKKNKKQCKLAYALQIRASTLQTKRNNTVACALQIRAPTVK